MQQKQQCVIYANCQGTGLARFLECSPFFSKHFSITLWSNWADTQYSHKVLRQCKIFLYQPTAQRDHVPSTAEMVGALARGAEAISFPYMYFKALWPFHQRATQQDVGKWIPQERHYYADFVLDQLAATSLPLDRVLSIYMRMDFHQEHNVLQTLEETLRRQRHKEQELDIKTYDIVASLFQHDALFLTVRHPTNTLYRMVANRVLQLLRLPLLKETPLPTAPIYTVQYEHPIHPGVVNALGLRHVEQAHKYNIWGDYFSYEEYAIDYVRHRRAQRTLTRKAA